MTNHEQIQANTEHNNTPGTPLPQWASISAISQFYGIPQNTIRDAVRIVWRQQEPWVKREYSKQYYYRIDTSHEQYLLHIQRWLAQRTVEHTDITDATTPIQQQTFQAQEANSRQDETSPEHKEQPADHDQNNQGDQGNYNNNSKNSIHRGKQFRRWLLDEGVQIFQNLLDENIVFETSDKLWDWRWGKLHGEGCLTEELAVIALLQARFAALNRQIEMGQKEIADLQHVLDNQGDRYEAEIQHLRKLLSEAQDAAQKHGWFASRS